MPIYLLKCPQGHTFEVFAKMADDRARIACACGAVGCETIPCLPRTERRFAGRESISVTEGFHPDEIRDAHRLFPQHQHCIRDDGSVVFSTRGEQRSYVKRRKELAAAGAFNT